MSIRCRKDSKILKVGSLYVSKTNIRFLKRKSIALLPAIAVCRSGISNVEEILIDASVYGKFIAEGMIKLSSSNLYKWTIEPIHYIPTGIINLNSTSDINFTKKYIFIKNIDIKINSNNIIKSNLISSTQGTINLSGSSKNLLILSFSPSSINNLSGYGFIGRSHSSDGVLSVSGNSVSLIAFRVYNPNVPINVLGSSMNKIHFKLDSSGTISTTGSAIARFVINGTGGITVSGEQVDPYPILIIGPVFETITSFTASSKSNFDSQLVDENDANILLEGRNGITLWNRQDPTANVDAGNLLPRFIYYSWYVNGSWQSSQRLRTLFWKKHQLIAPANATAVAIASSDGSQFTTCNVNHPLAIQDTPVGGGLSLNTSQWHPEATQIVNVNLSGSKQTINISSSSHRVILISEFDGTNWSPRHQHVIFANSSIDYPADASKLCIETFDRATLTIKGASSVVNTPIPTYLVTSGGTTTVTNSGNTTTNGNNFKTALTNSSEYGEIVLEPGTYNLNGTGINLSLYPNRTIRSSTGVRADVIINSSVNISSFFTTSSLSTSQKIVIKDLTIQVNQNVTGAQVFEASYGKIILDNVVFTGDTHASSDVAFINYAPPSNNGILYLIKCHFEGNVNSDSLNMGGVSNQCYVIGCTGDNGTNVAPMQLFTTHQNCHTKEFGNYWYHNTLGLVVAHVDTTKNLAVGTRYGGYCQGSAFYLHYGCLFETSQIALLNSGVNATLVSEGLGPYFIHCRASSMQNIGRMGTSDNIIYRLLGCWFNKTNANLGLSYGLNDDRGCGELSGSLVGSYDNRYQRLLEINHTTTNPTTVSPFEYDIHNNTMFCENIIQKSGSSTANPTNIKVHNNVIIPTRGLIATLGTVTSNGNLYELAQDGITLGANDLADEKPDATGEYVFPTTNGNLDNTGVYSSIDYIGGFSWDGGELILSSTNVQRGAKPILRLGDLYPVGIQRGLTNPNRTTPITPFDQTWMSTWFDASMNVINTSDLAASNGDSIKSWTQKDSYIQGVTINGTLNQTTAPNHPTLITNSFGTGIHGINFVGASSQFLSNTTFSSININCRSFFMVFKTAVNIPSGETGLKAIASIFNMTFCYGSGWDVTYSVPASNDLVFGVRSTGATGWYEPTGTFITAGTIIAIVGSRFETGSPKWRFWGNGSLLSPLTTGNADTPAGEKNVTIGKDLSNRQFSGEIAEFATFNRCLSAEDAAQINSYLLSKYTLVALP